MNIGDILSEDGDEEPAKEQVYPWPYPLVVAPQLLPGRTRRCAFWISHFVPHGMRYVIDTKELLRGGENQQWVHNPARDGIPEDAILVVIRADDAEHIRKAMATWSVAPNPAFIAARIVDSMCREDPTLAGRMRWTVRS